MKSENKALTLIELIISIAISAIVLLFVVKYITDVLWLIWETRQSVANQSNIEQIIHKIDEFQQDFPVLSTLNLENDILVMKNYENTDGVMLGIIEAYNNSFSNDIDAEKYQEKYLGYRYLWFTDFMFLDLSMTWATMFYDVPMKGLEISEFWSGTWKIIDLQLDVLKKYYPDLEWQKFSDIPSYHYTQYNYSF